MNFFEIKNEQGCFLENDILISSTGDQIGILTMV